MLPVCERYGMGVIPWSPLAGGWLTGRYRKGRRAAGEHARRPAPVALRHVAAREPAQARGGRGARPCSPRRPGSSLIHLAIAFVLRHPAVTSAIIGPRTMEQLESQLGAAEVELADDVLDRIDEIVPPGTNLNPADAGYTPPSLEHASLRRR